MKLSKLFLTGLLLVNTLSIFPVSAEEEVLNSEEEVVLEEVSQKELEMLETTEAQEEIIIPEVTILEEEPTTEENVEVETTEEVEPTEEPTIEVTPEVTPEPTEEPTIEPTVEPTPEATPEVTVEPTPEVTPEPTIEPTPEITPEPTLEPTVEPTETPEAVEELEESKEEEATEEVVEEEELVDAAGDPTRVVGGTTKSSAKDIGTIPSGYGNINADKYFTTTNTTRSHWFKFVIDQKDIAEPGSFLQLSAINSTGDNIYYSLKHANGQTFINHAEYYNYVSSGNTGLDTFKLSYAGTYYLEVKTYSAGEVNIAITKQKDDVSDSADKAKAITLGKLNSYKVHGNGDEDWFKFTAKGTWAHISAVEINDSLYSWEVYNSSLAYIGGKDRWSSHTSSYGFDVENGKTYYIVFRSNYNNTVGDYNFTVSTHFPAYTIALNKKEQSLTVGNKATLKATVGPSNASNKKVNWSSSNTSVATVDSKGVVTAVGIGSATIYARLDYNNDRYATCEVTVSLPKIKATAVYNSAKGADIRWKPAKGVEYYAIYRKRTNPVTGKLDERYIPYTSVKYTDVIAIVSQNSDSVNKLSNGDLQYIDGDLKNLYTDKGKEWEGGWVYYIRARDTSSKYWYTEGEISNKLNLYRLRNPKFDSKQSKAIGSGKVQLKWNRVPTAHTYEISYSLDGKTWTKLSQVKGENNTSLTVSGLKKGKLYHFRIRCQKTNANLGTTWSEYSPWKDITVK